MGKCLWQLVDEHGLPPLPLQEPLPDWIVEWMRDKNAQFSSLTALEDALRDPNGIMDGEPFVMD